MSPAVRRRRETYRRNHPWASDREIDEMIVRRMQQSMGTHQKLYLEAAEIRRLSVLEKHPAIVELAELNLIEVQEHLWVLTERGEELLKGYRK